ncbi:hypothetical protein WJX84_000660 [Apatococcus fuscideae]|uniref:Secreted protein n=1 Tax=Apatococcus fuscideae TaxID=2026836 RepID=A0AAW1T1E6_9CHLO
MRRVLNLLWCPVGFPSGVVLEVFVQQCFTAEQCGKIIVQAYPWCPDAAAICRVVAAGHGNSQFHELPAEY